MSLQKCPHCKKNNGFWYIYWKLNASHFKKTVRCQKCDKKMEIRAFKTPLPVRIFEGLLWLSPAILLMYFVGTGQLGPLKAIILVTLYHFLCFIGIIKFWKYKK